MRISKKNEEAKEIRYKYYLKLLYINIHLCAMYLRAVSNVPDKVCVPVLYQIKHKWSKPLFENVTKKVRPLKTIFKTWIPALGTDHTLVP